MACPTASCIGAVVRREPATAVGTADQTGKADESAEATAGEPTSAADKLSTRDKADTQRIPPDGTPGYATLTLRGGWNVNKDLSVFAAVENVTNEDYRIHGSGVNEPGTNLVVGLDWRF